MNNGSNTDYTDGADKFLHRELSYQIIGICMKIHNEYGPHHNERIYHKVLEEYFERHQIVYLSKPKIPVYSKESGKEIGYYQPDIVAGSVILIELKATPIPLRRDEKQLSEYLKTSHYEVAYLINFGTNMLYYKRIIYTNDRKNFLSATKKKSV